MKNKQQGFIPLAFVILLGIITTTIITTVVTVKLTSYKESKPTDSINEQTKEIPEQTTEDTKEGSVLNTKVEKNKNIETKPKDNNTQSEEKITPTDPEILLICDEIENAVVDIKIPETDTGSEHPLYQHTKEKIDAKTSLIERIKELCTILENQEYQTKEEKKQYEQEMIEKSKIWELSSY